MALINEIERSLPKIERLLTKETLFEISRTSPEDLEEYDILLGPMLRIRLLRPGNTLYKCFVKEGISSRDEMVSTTIKAFHKYIQTKAAAAFL